MDKYKRRRKQISRTGKSVQKGKERKYKSEGKKTH